MSDYLRGAFFYLLCFFAGCGFTALVFLWALRSYGAQPKSESEERNLQSAAAFALRQLLFFLAMGTLSFVLVGGLLWLRDKSQSIPDTGNLQPSTQVAAQRNPTQSQLTGVLLPAGAEAVSDPSILGTSSEQLQRLVKQVDTQSTLGASEVLMWRDVSREQATTRIAEVRQALQSSGWIYQETGAPNSSSGGVREFIAANTRRKQIVPGFWLITDQFLLLSWGEAKAS